MLTYEHFIEDRKKMLKNIFKDKSTKWINDNIIFNYFAKNIILKPNDFKLISNAINNPKKITPTQYDKIFYWIEYAYTPLPIIDMFFPKIISPPKELEQKGLVKYYIYSYNPNNIFITFRGTKTFWEALNGIKFYRVPFLILEEKDNKKFFDWRNKTIQSNNFDKLKIPLPNDKDIEIHKGFLDEASLIYADCVKNIGELISNNKNPITINLCGHSLGGVLAKIIAIYLAYFLQDAISKGKLIINIISANAPPIGNKNFNLLIPYLGIKNFIRFYNYQDFVPHYGYLGSWIESKKFRHLDFMLKDGISGQNTSIGRQLHTKINKTNIFVKDFGKNLDNFLLSAKKNLPKPQFNDRYIYHDIFVVNPKHKSLFI